MAVLLNCSSSFGDENLGVGLELYEGISFVICAWEIGERYLERDYKAVWSPLLYHGLQNLGDLIHLDVQTALTRLDLMLGLHIKGTRNVIERACAHGARIYLPSSPSEYRNH